MKQFNLLKSLLLCTFLVLCSTACNDDDGQIPMPNPETECKLISVMDDDTTTYAYNTQGYVSSERTTRQGSSSEIKYVYDDTQVVRADHYYEGESVSEYYYHGYNNDSLLTDVQSAYPDGSDGGELHIEYDSKGRIIVLRDFGVVYITYTYDDNDNITKIEMPGAAGATIYEDYDNNPTPYSAVKGLPVYEGRSKNNPGKEIRTTDYNNDGIIQPTEREVITYTYTYNSNGYPTKIVETDRLDIHVKTFAYECK